MTVTPTSSSTQTDTSSNSLFGTSDTTQTFMQLLTTELQNQDPTQPMDPTEMVGQLVQLNMLSEMMTIGQTVQQIASDLSGTSAATN
jgi:flagellar basal-body rod modification protein FlgD